MTRKPIQSALIFVGISTAVLSGAYLVAGMLGVLPLESEAMGWNNIRIVSGLSILGCLMAAVGYGNE